MVPALKRLLRTSPDQLARAHALWTLEGLGALDAALVREQMESRDPQMRIHAIRASETLYKGGDRSFASDWAALAKDPDADVTIQALLTSSLFKPAGFAATVQAAQAKNPARGVQEIGRQLLQPDLVLEVVEGVGSAGHDVQSMMTLPESPCRAAANAASCSRNPNRWVMAGVMSSPDWSMTVILYQVSYISRP